MIFKRNFYKMYLTNNNPDRNIARCHWSKRLLLFYYMIDKSYMLIFIQIFHDKATACFKEKLFF